MSGISAAVAKSGGAATVRTASPNKIPIKIANTNKLTSIAISPTYDKRKDTDLMNCAFCCSTSTMLMTYPGDKFGVLWYVVVNTDANSTRYQSQEQGQDDVTEGHGTWVGEAVAVNEEQKRHHSQCCHSRAGRHHNAEIDEDQLYKSYL